MIKLIKNLFNSDTAVKAIDALVLTEEEKTQYKLKALESYATFKLAQRYFMMIVTLPYMTAWTLTFFAIFGFDLKTGDMTSTKDYIMNGDLIWIVLAMAGFYFGDTILGKRVEAKKAK